MTHAQATRITMVFQKLLASKQTALQNGAVKRQQMMEALNAGDDVSNHVRFQWMNEAARAAIQSIAETAKVYNAAHPNDGISVQDLIDSLELAIGMLKEHAG